jgi:FkbM family methyltransferase
MMTHTKTLFSSVLKTLNADCVCDIGSRDGNQALLFRHLLPDAVVLAFEANPLNFRAMAAKPGLQAACIDIFPYAISGETGHALFHITEVDYSSPEENIGTSSLFVHKGLKINQSIEVEVYRIDDFILSRYPSVNKIGLWIDAEGAEYGIIEGIERIRDRVLALHVETAKTSMRIGQRTYSELLPLAKRMGFTPCGSNMRRDAIWGDVVFVSETASEALGRHLILCQIRALAAKWLCADSLAVALKTRLPWLYRLLRGIYIKVGT